LSVYSPKRRDFSAFGRQSVSQTTVLASLGVQAVIVGTGVAAFMLARYYQNLWIAALIFLALSVVSITVYALVLRRFDGIAAGRREALLEALCRA
jgi:ABC-type arginine transport system permease subunit